jgi:hypothetical protein
MKFKRFSKKVAKFAQVLGILNNTLRPTMVQKSSRIKIYNAVALPILLCGSEIWTFRQNNKNRLTTIEMKFSRRTAGYTLFDHKRNGEILEQLKAEPVDEKLRRYKSNWLQHVTRMNNNRIPKIMLNYRPNGRKRLGGPLKRLLKETVTGLLAL